MFAYHQWYAYHRLGTPALGHNNCCLKTFSWDDSFNWKIKCKENKLLTYNLLDFLKFDSLKTFYKSRFTRWWNLPTSWWTTATSPRRRRSWRTSKTRSTSPSHRTSQNRLILTSIWQSYNLSFIRNQTLKWCSPAKMPFQSISVCSILFRIQSKF